MHSFIKRLNIFFSLMLIFVSAAFSAANKENPADLSVSSSDQSLQSSGHLHPPRDAEPPSTLERTLWADDTKEIKIVLAPSAEPADCRIVGNGLHEYNKRKVTAGETTEPDDSFGGTLKVRSHVVGEVIGLKVNASLALDLDELQKALDCQDTLGACQFLPQIIRNVVARKDGHIHQILTETSDESCFESLKSKGFTELCPPLLNLKTGKSTQAFYINALPYDSEPDVCVSGDIQWETSSSSPEQLKDFFGVFIRTSKDVKGGLLGNLHRNATIPHAYIENFWIDDSIRGTGLGTKLIRFAEDFIKEQGLSRIRLGTCTFQAPGFYRKAGYKEVFRVPQIFQLLDGTWADNFTFEKFV